MRAISLVDRIELQFIGNVARNALTFGDVDNDGFYEFIVGNNVGQAAIYKGKEKVQTITVVTFISCIAVGDILNKNRNSLIIVTADGWCHIYDHIPDSESAEDVDKNDGSESKKPLLECIHSQRIPANAKDLVLGDIDSDGQIEMILGLTDRVVRTYRWLDKSKKTDPHPESDPAKVFGELVALNKWECAKQIGSITLHHSEDGRPSLLIAQPGGTFMRIRYQFDDSCSSQTADIETSSGSTQSESMSGFTIDYKYLGKSRMRNPDTSTEILGDFKSSPDIKKHPYAVATLDGTILLVQDEVILRAIAVNHQIFALTKLDVTGDGMDEIVACAWDGQTYILDQKKNSVRFQMEEPVQAFSSGYFSVCREETSVPCFAYVTFKNTIFIYYDIPLKEMTCRRFEPDDEVLVKFYMAKGKSREEAVDIVKDLDRNSRSEIVEFLLYNVNSETI